MQQKDEAMGMRCTDENTIRVVTDWDRTVESWGGAGIISLGAFLNLTGQGPEQIYLTMKLILLLAKVPS